ncbi:MAG: (4Fe-4S)-binding protein, partial [Gammaproteobacteria bacterium]
MDELKVTTYTGDEIDVQWDSRLCIHIGECGYARGELFVGGRDPWCQPDLVSTDETMDVVSRCPSGALSYQVKNSSVSEVPAAENTVQVVYNGPLYVQGDLDIEGATDDMPGLNYRAALCRCGLSSNK